MKSLLFILLAGYAVRSEDNNYYVIDVPPSHTNLLQGRKPFKVYWNVPTMQCASKKIPFEHLYKNYGIIQNENDRFKGEKVTILYDPGLFPALFKNESGGQIRFRNGGVPQEGDLNKHLEEFKKELDRSIPDKSFNGIGIIDFESWRPTFRQNFGVLQPYKDVSIEIERKLHWWWKKQWIEEEAKRRFEEAARTYMEGTLSVAKKLRPSARWGFYGFPYCFNMASNNMFETCANNVPQENDEISWLWSGSTALYPSVYSSAKLSTSQLVSLIRGRIREAARCARNNNKDILPYFWFRYRDAGFLSETDLSMALSTLYESRATGIIIWGSSNDVNTVEKCNKLLDYLHNSLGPAIAKYTKPIMRDTEENENKNSLNTDIVTETSHNISDVDTILDPDIHWTPPENYTQNLKDDVEQIKRRFGQNKTDNDTVLRNNSVLIDLILNAVLISENNGTTTITEAPKTKNDKKTEFNELVSSTTEMFDNISTVTNKVITKNPLHDETEDSSTKLETQTIEVNTQENSKIENVTTEKIIVETVISSANTESHDKTDLTDLNLSGTETITTDKAETETVIDSNYDDVIDNNFFNVETFIKLFNGVKTITYEDATDSINIDVTKSKKKDQTKRNDIFEIYLGETTTDKLIDIQTTDESQILESLSTEFLETDTFLGTNNQFSVEGVEYTTESNTILVNATKYIISKDNTINATENQTDETTTTESERLFELSTYGEGNKFKSNECSTADTLTTRDFIISSETVFTTEETEINTELEATEWTSTTIMPTEQVVV